MSGLSLHRKPWRAAIIIVICGVTLDFGSKIWAQQLLLQERFFKYEDNYPACTGIRDEMRRAWFVNSNSQKLEIVPNLFQLRYVENCGSSFQLLDEIKEGIRFPFLMLIGIIAIVALPYLYLRTPSRQKYTLHALPLVLSGALGNFVDRLHYRYVVDFIDGFVVFRGKAYHWPTFNIADALILAGLGLMVLHLFKEKQND